MVVIGAMGMAKQLLQILYEIDMLNDLFFFDNVTPILPRKLYDRFPIIRSFDELKDVFDRLSPNYTLGTGCPSVRFNLNNKVDALGGSIQSVVSPTAIIGKFDTHIGKGVTILSNAIIECSTIIGNGALINNSAIISHDSSIGKYCEISPGAKILGRVTVGDFSEVGSNAVILPDIKVGCRCKIGAGAVVTKDIPDDSTVVGVPAKPLIKRPEDK